MVRDMVAADAGWAAELMNQRRQVYASYSPVFWRPARDATGPHAAYLSTLIGSANWLSLRTDHGFMLGRIGPAKTFVDDFAVSEPSRWSTDGSALVLAAAQRLADAGRDSIMLVVTAHADTRRAEPGTSKTWLDRRLRLVPGSPGYERHSPGFIAELRVPAQHVAGLCRVP